MIFVIGRAFGDAWINGDTWTQRCRCVLMCVIDFGDILMLPTELLGLLSVLMLSVIGELTGN